MKKVYLLALAAMPFFTRVACAQDAAGVQKWQAYMTPGDMQQLMSKFCGTWTSENKMWMSPGTDPQESKGECSYTMILGGRYQQGNITGSFPGMPPYEGFSLMGYDNDKKVFTSVWIDNYGTGTATASGPYDAATKTITLKGTMYEPMSGKDLSTRETIQFVDDDHQVLTLYFVNSQGAEFKSTEIRYTRKK
jgi:Protein of unknown function (DUF1579)